jgi:hypothetical protein
VTQQAALPDVHREREQDTEEKSTKRREKYKEKRTKNTGLV